MIELPNKLISRTLPEQVGFNSAKIEEIIKWINDSDFIDKVLNLSDPSGTLTEAQYAIADLSPSYIVYGGKVFVKSLEDSDNIDFFKVGTDMSGSDSIVASVERIRIVKATKAYQYAVVQLFESYNKTQLDSLLATKANLSGATFTGEVIAQKLHQTTPNWEATATPTLDASAITAGLTLTPIYNKVLVLNNILYIVMVNKINNPTASSISISGSYTISLRITNVPEEIGSKIIDLNGNPLNVSGSTAIDYNRQSAGSSSGVGSINYRMQTGHAGANNLECVLIREDSYNILAGGAATITARNFLVLV